MIPEVKGTVALDLAQHPIGRPDGVMGHLEHIGDLFRHGYGEDEKI